MMNNKVNGYKAYTVKNGELIDNFGNSYKVGELYIVNSEEGSNKRQFQFCTHPADTLRYVDGFNDEIAVCEVVGSGDLQKYDDHNYDYYDMYLSSSLEISRIIPRAELINEILYNSSYPGVERLVSGLKLTDDELNCIISYLQKDNYWLHNKNTIDYYVKNVQNYENKIQRVRK